MGGGWGDEPAAGGGEGVSDQVLLAASTAERCRSLRAGRGPFPPPPLAPFQIFRHILALAEIKEKPAGWAPGPAAHLQGRGDGHVGPVEDQATSWEVLTHVQEGTCMWTITLLLLPVVKHWKQLECSPR